MHYINGKWMESGDASFNGSNPATGEIIWQGQAALTETVDLAISSAKAAFPQWRDLELSDRIAYLKSYQEALQQSKHHLAETISKSTGKPLWESLTEVASMINKVAISIEAYHLRCPYTEKVQPPQISITTHRAHGVMGVLGPFNFPGHLPNGHIVPALLAGNTIVYKPSELTPLVAEEMLKCWAACDLPKGVINMVQGGRETGQAVSMHPELDGLLFTGSWPTGKELAIHMAKTPYKILALEMGGNNPLVIGKLSNIDAAAYLTLQSAFLTSGQRCTCARRLIIPKGEMGDRLISVLSQMTKHIHIGSYTDRPEPFMGPLISSQAADKLLQAQEKLVTAGAIPLLPLARTAQGPAFVSPGLIDVTPIADRPDEELFGPLLQIIRVAGFPEALAVANQTAYGLAAGLFSESEEEYRLFFKSIRAGIVNWNTPLTGASSASPFGGIGRSGNNRPSALYAADYCAYPVASLISEQLQMPAIKTPGIILPNK